MPGGGDTRRLVQRNKLREGKERARVREDLLLQCQMNTQSPTYRLNDCQQWRFFSASTVMAFNMGVPAFRADGIIDQFSTYWEGNPVLRSCALVTNETLAGRNPADLEILKVGEKTREIRGDGVAAGRRISRGIKSRIKRSRSRSARCRNELKLCCRRSFGVVDSSTIKRWERFPRRRPSCDGVVGQ